MSKLLELYKHLKEENDEDVYLFQSGIFYIFIDEDAKKMHQFLNLRLTNLNATTLKCGFPINSLEKYTNLLKNSSFKLKIINNISSISYSKFTQNEVYTNKNSINLLKEISKVNIDSLSIEKAYDFIYYLKEKSTDILNKGNIK